MTLNSRSHSSWRTRALLLALGASLLPAAAFAQNGPRVRINREKTKVVSGHVAKSWLVMTAAKGTVLDVIHVDGDPNEYRESNWYWVLLPRDEWGTQRAGWVSGRDVDPHPSIEQAAFAQSIVTSGPADARTPVEGVAVPAARTAAAATPVVVAPTRPGANAGEPVAEASRIVHFAFNKSELTDEAKAELARVVASLKPGAGGASFALEGHADWIGPEDYNDTLGMARAEAVRQHLAATHGILSRQINVISRGEHNPAAPNATAEGRAENRRVVIKIVAP
jgi:outer membrane protein OmpA-like peptidoglycan-associated protein